MSVSYSMRRDRGRRGSEVEQGYLAEEDSWFERLREAIGCVGAGGHVGQGDLLSENVLLEIMILDVHVLAFWRGARGGGGGYGALVLAINSSRSS